MSKNKVQLGVSVPAWVQEKVEEAVENGLIPASRADELATKTLQEGARLGDQESITFLAAALTWLGRLFGR